MIASHDLERRPGENLSARVQPCPDVVAAAVWRTIGARR
jgi:hypothetical protein